MASRIWMMAAGCFLAGAAGLQAQMIVHAVSGTVTAVNAGSHTVDVAVEPNATSEFKVADAGQPPRLVFENDLRADATDAAKFEHVGDYAVVYFYGVGNDQTAVAVRDLGPGPYKKADVTVTAYDKHTRMVTVKPDGGAAMQLKLDDHLVVDNDESVDSGRKYSPHKGDHARITYATNEAGNDLVFLHHMN
jgi:hypothetical protein